MDAHLTFMGTFMARNNPQALSLLQKNCLEHIALMAQEQGQMEFEDEMAEAQQMQAFIQQAGPQGAKNPQVMQIQQKLQQLKGKIDSRKAQLIAQHMTEYAEEEKKVLNQLDSDPLIKLKADEVQIKAQDQQRKEKYDEERANLDTLKLLQGKSEFDEKLEQDDEHAKLRAAVSLAKDGLKSMDATIKSGGR